MKTTVVFNEEEKKEKFHLIKYDLLSDLQEECSSNFMFNEFEPQTHIIIVTSFKNKLKILNVMIDDVARSIRLNEYTIEGGYSEQIRKFKYKFQNDKVCPRTVTFVDNDVFSQIHHRLLTDSIYCNTNLIHKLFSHSMGRFMS